MSTRTVDVLYDFTSKELMIGFFTREQALAYQAKNPEARILAAAEKCVWLPIPSDMKCLRASGFGFVMCFNDAYAAQKWCSRSVLGRPYYDTRDNTDVYIRREWKETELNAWLGANQAGRLSPGGDRSPNTLASRSPRIRPVEPDDVGFGVAVQENSEARRRGYGS